MSVFITDIGTATPKHKITQHEVLRFMQKAHGLNQEEARKLEVLYRATGIQSRYSVIEDYKKSSGYSFFPNNESLSPFPATSTRNQLYKDHVVDLSAEAIFNAVGKEFDFGQVTHLITVSCTGLFAPGLDIALVNKLGLKSTVERTAINYMGCYAAFNAIKVAKNICCSQPKASVLVVCTEICSLHFQKENNDNNLLANALFGDGSAALLITSEKKKGVNLSLEQFFCDLLPNGSEEMAWEVGDHGFEMKLSSYVPDIIQGGVGQLVDKLNHALEEVNPRHYAIHPGGKKILGVLENALSISKEENRHAHNVLKNYGNMSSPTILFVLKEILNNLSIDNQNDKVLSFAFGPGLTLESMILTVIYAK
ncbi:MAG: type III polyketide synthase [Fulvivirga sp.]